MHLCNQAARSVVEASGKAWVVRPMSSLLNLDASQVQAVRLVVLSLRREIIPSAAVQTV